MGSLTELEDPPFPILSALAFFLYSPMTRSSFSDLSDQEDESFCQSVSMYHLHSSLPLSCSEDNTARKTTRTFIPAVSPPSVGFPSQLEFLYFSKVSGSCSFVFWQVLYFDQQERDFIVCICHHAESVIYSFSDFLNINPMVSMWEKPELKPRSLHQGPSEPCCFS